MKKPILCQSQRLEIKKCTDDGLYLCLYIIYKKILRYLSRI